MLKNVEEKLRGEVDGGRVNRQDVEKCRAGERVGKLGYIVVYKSNYCRKDTPLYAAACSLYISNRGRVVCFYLYI